MKALSDPAHWSVVVTTIAVISLIIALHYEVLRGCIRFLPALMHRRRQRVVLLILIILLTHALEIWFFGLAYYGLLRFDTLGAIGGAASTSNLLDYVYFSSIVYTTVGFGDLVPQGPIRFMAGMEALTGFVMITWSASFTFLEMQRDWRVGRD